MLRWRPVGRASRLLHRSFLHRLHLVVPRPIHLRTDHSMTRIIQFTGALLGTLIGFALGLALLQRAGEVIEPAEPSGVPDRVRRRDPAVRLPRHPVHHHLPGPPRGREAERGRGGRVRARRGGDRGRAGHGRPDRHSAGGARRSARNARAGSGGAVPGLPDAGRNPVQARRAAGRARMRSVARRTEALGHEPGRDRYQLGHRRAHRRHRAYRVRARHARGSAVRARRAAADRRLARRAAPQPRATRAGDALRAPEGCRHHDRGQRGDLSGGRGGRRQADGVRPRPRCSDPHQRLQPQPRRGPRRGSACSTSTSWRTR